MVIPIVLMIIDLALIYSVFYFGSEFRFLAPLQKEAGSMTPHIFALSWLFSYLLNLGYFIENLSSVHRILKYFLRAIGLYAFLLFILFATQTSSSQVWILIMFLHVSTSSMILLTRLCSYKIYRVYKNLPLNQKNTIIIGYNQKSKTLYEYFNRNNDLPNKVVGVFDNNSPNDLSLMSLFYQGGLNQVKEFCIKNDVKEIYFTLNIESQVKYIEDLTEFVDEHFIYLGFISNTDKIDLGHNVEAKVFDNGKIPVISYRKLPLRFTANAMVKRLFDIIFSSMALLVLCPTIFLLLALLIKLTSKGPVFFIQLRPGYNNKMFKCFKFRTMVINSEGHKQTAKKDSRITPIGAFLRKTSLDELPQFINVLKGDMSVVGPRPNLTAQLEQYGKIIEDYTQRHAVAPGITGYAQISGYRGATNTIEDMQKRVDHDLWYMENWSVRFDIQIIVNTVVNIFKGEENAY